MTRIIYDLGKIVGDDKESVQQQIDELHHHPAIQSKCDEFEKSGAKYLRFSASEHGASLVAKCVIPHTSLRSGGCVSSPTLRS
jgi:hypothetical protein